MKLVEAVDDGVDDAALLGKRKAVVLPDVPTRDALHDKGRIGVDLRDLLEAELRYVPVPRHLVDGDAAALLVDAGLCDGSSGELNVIEGPTHGGLHKLLESCDGSHFGDLLEIERLEDSSLLLHPGN